jgi:hypothetical protein
MRCNSTASARTSAGRVQVLARIFFEVCPYYPDLLSLAGLKWYLDKAIGAER